MGPPSDSRSRAPEKSRSLRETPCRTAQSGIPEQGCSTAACRPVLVEDVDQVIKRDIGTRIRRQREHVGLSQRELGAALDVDQREVSRWEVGRIKPSGASLRRIAEELGCDWRLLAYGTTEVEPA